MSEHVKPLYTTVVKGVAAEIVVAVDRFLDREYYLTLYKKGKKPDSWEYKKISKELYDLLLKELSE
jgi:hypothetical protein